jgi:hypothetical protein
MNDLTQLRDFGRGLDHDLAELSPALRDRILSSFEQHSGRARWLPQARRNPRLPRRLPIPVTVVATLTAAVVCLTALGFWGGTPAADAQAVRILNRAASAALQRPAPHIRPSDFVFTRVLEMAATIGVRDHHPLVSHTSVLREQWLSASGRRTGLLRERPFSIPLGHPTGRWRAIVLQGCVHGHLVPSGSAGHTPGGTSYGRCRPVPADLAHLPTTEPAMRRYLYHHLAGQNPPDQQAFITAGDLIRDSYIRPAALAAIFRAVAHIPGVTVVHGAVSANGRRGIAVQRVFHGVSDQLIFDPHTYAVIGERQVVVGPGAGLKAGTILDLTTLLVTRIVHNVGQTR